MAIVARWSDTACWKCAFSVCRSSPACFKLTLVSATTAARVSRSPSSVEMESSRFVFVASRSAFSESFTFTLSSVSSSSFLQNSNFAVSDFCWALSSPSILSITSFTFSKGSRRNRSANEARLQFFCLRATRMMCCVAALMALLATATWTALARVARSAPAPVCNKLNVLPNRSRASSSLRMAMASPSAWISSARTFEREAYSSFADVQLFERSSKNCWSAERALRVAAMSSLVFATLLAKSASAFSFAACCAASAAISASLAAFNCEYAAAASISAFSELERLFSKSFFNCDNTPTIWPLRKLYDTAPAAAPSIGAATAPAMASTPSWPALRASAERVLRPEEAGPGDTRATSNAPITSQMSCCMTLRKCTSRCLCCCNTSCRSSLRASRNFACNWRSKGLICALRSERPPRCSSCTLESTAIASPSVSMHSLVSVASLVNSAASFTRIAVAFSNASLSSAMLEMRAPISVLSLPCVPTASSTKASSSEIFASAASTAASLAFVLVSHQHSYLW
mmetsp:Transcript_9905/g.26142  ORF Transcript_9905/g.26142 Transcript_9905/m.26142 type:complete len:515 (+) Transcript_9905:617-2161(+)